MGLPAWATVAVAIGGAAIGALAGVFGAYFGFRGTMLSAYRQENERWNTRLIEAAEDYSRAWTSKLDVDEHGSLEDREARDKTSLALAEQLVRVMLLFGVQSPASQAAQDASRSLEEGRSARMWRVMAENENVTVPDPDVDPRLPFDESRESHLRFMQAVHDVVQVRT